LTFYQPNGYSLQTAIQIAATDTVVTATPFTGSQALALPDGVAVGTAIAISNFSPMGTSLLVFSALPIDSGAPGGSAAIAANAAAKTFTKTTGGGVPGGGWATS
jgi:hypothetical protein